MTFIGLLLRFVIGYAFGLLAGPFLPRTSSTFGDISIRGGIAGALGASMPYVLLNSIWSERIPLALTRHEHWVGATACLLAIAATEIIAGPSRLPEARGAAKWLWLCAPALVYRIWEYFFGHPPAIPPIVYVMGALSFVGLVGYAVVYSVSFLRATK
jgi:hypothetical protein